MATQTQSGAGTYTQAGRPLVVETALGTDKLLLAGFSGEEMVSSPFRFTLDLLAHDDAIDGEKLLRTPAGVKITLADGSVRTLHGMINRFVQLGQYEGMTSYRAELVPWVWFLSLSSDCRIFQNLSVLDIVKQVFSDLGFKDFQSKCVKSYPKREYCVQYRETNLDFVSRLLEEEGIFYFFEHQEKKHTLVLADDKSAVKPAPGAAKVRMAPSGGTELHEDGIQELAVEHVARTGVVSLADYNPLTPSAQLLSKMSGKQKEEAYDYPGSFGQRDVGDRYARLRLEEHEALEMVVRGEGNCRALQSGAKFDLLDHYRDALNQSYFVLSVAHEAKAGLAEDESGQSSYRSRFVAIPYATPYHPVRKTPKPRVYGSQTALVVGKGGEEIWVDKYGRVKVQFFWDRKGKKDENSSCWVRVSSAWAGKGWGVIQIPRIGQEVIVDFLEGDPDQPIVTGRVYNAEQVPPYALPANQTQSGVKTRSTKGGGTDNFNEIRFEDKKGAEELYIHAEKDQKIVVENDRTDSVGHDEATQIGNNQSLSVGNNQSISVGGNQSISVAKDRTLNVDGGESIAISKDRSENVQGGEGVNIGKDRSHSVGKNESLSVGENRSVDVGKNESVAIAEKRSVSVGKDDELSVGKNLTITVEDEITIKTGDAMISMKKNGDITIKGKNITLDGSGKVGVKAGSDVAIKGSKVTAN